jgi:hypothetical protein
VSAESTLTERQAGVWVIVIKVTRVPWQINRPHTWPLATKGHIQINYPIIIILMYTEVGYLYPCRGSNIPGNRLETVVLIIQRWCDHVEQIEGKILEQVTLSPQATNDSRCKFKFEVLTAVPTQLSTQKFTNLP